MYCGTLFLPGIQPGAAQVTICLHRTHPRTLPCYHACRRLLRHNKCWAFIDVRGPMFHVRCHVGGTRSWWHRKVRLVRDTLNMDTDTLLEGADMASELGLFRICDWVHNPARHTIDFKMSDPRHALDTRLYHVHCCSTDRT